MAAPADVFRNAYAQLAIALYRFRASPGPPVSTPLGWDELNEGLNLGQFTILTVPHRISGNNPVSRPARRGRGSSAPSSGYGSRYDEREKGQ